MIHAYILFVLISGSTTTTLTTQEFSSKEGCDHAAQALTSVLESVDYNRKTVWCFPKNGIDD